MQKKEERCDVAGLYNGGRRPHMIQGTQETSRIEKGRDMDSPIESLGGAQPSLHLDFSAVKASFGTSDLQKCKRRT